MQSTPANTVTQNGLAPGNADGAWVAISTASGIETNETLRAIPEPGEISLTSPDA
jgi:hypothetical protein